MQDLREWLRNAPTEAAIEDTIEIPTDQLTEPVSVSEKENEGLRYYSRVKFSLAILDDPGVDINALVISNLSTRIKNTITGDQKIGRKVTATRSLEETEQNGAGQTVPTLWPTIRYEWTQG